MSPVTFREYRYLFIVSTLVALFILKLPSDVSNAGDAAVLAYKNVAETVKVLDDTKTTVTNAFDTLATLRLP
jgi:hypothetical protein